jgi:hypothetical protein
MTVRLKAGIAIAAALCAGLVLTGCSSTGDFELDPAYWFPDGKKKLPGERRELFPGGVPGVTQGVPPEMIKGSPQQQAAQAAEAGQAQPQPEPPKPEPKAAQKSKPKKVARPAAPPVDPDAEEAQPAARPPQRQAQPGAWPAPQGQQPQQQQQPAPANSAWPAPPASGTFTR